jgi:hypothetical protein
LQADRPADDAAVVVNYQHAGHATLLFFITTRGRVTTCRAFAGDF